jgi:plasmid stabilization system protein ParE
MNPAVFHPEAQSELMESARYYESQQVGLGHRFLDAVAAALGRVQQHPQLYREVESGIRQCRVLRFPYGLIYRIKTDHLEIVAVMHLHRQPGYWRQRTS